MGYDAFFRFYSKKDLQLVSQDIRSIIDEGYSILVESSRTRSELRESVVERAIEAENQLDGSLASLSNERRSSDTPASPCSRGLCISGV